MRKKYRVMKLSLKLDTEVDIEGSFTGYGNVFDIIDSYRDVVMPGAFTQTLEEHKEAETMPKLLWQHDTAEPIGVYTEVKEDDHGLYVEGQLAVDDSVPVADKAYSLLKRKALDGLSIGYTIYPGGQHWNEDDKVMELTNINLWEMSIVTFAANPASGVETIRSAFDAGELPTVREFENFLRDAGFSKSESLAIISIGFKQIQRDAGDGQKIDQRDAASILETIERTNQLLTGS